MGMPKARMDRFIHLRPEHPEIEQQIWSAGLIPCKRSIFWEPCTVRRYGEV